MRSAILTRERLEELLGALPRVRALVVGDVCLDAYWIADMRLSALSRETPHHNLPVVEERYALGGAGSVVDSMRALGADVLTVAALGDDWRGGIVRDLFAGLGLDVSGLTAAPGRMTPTYVKPIRVGYGGVRYEDPRIDFENASPQGSATEEMLIAALKRGARDADVIAVSDQMAHGAVTESVRAALVALSRAGKTVIVDSRDNIARFEGCIVKPNELESARATGLTPAAVTPTDYLPVLEALARMTGNAAIVTLGAAGALCLPRGGEPWLAPGARVEGPIDIVGAGDSFLAATALALGAGAALPEAAALGNLAAAVAIGKLGQTGTACAGEILELHQRQG